MRAITVDTRAMPAGSRRALLVATLRAATGLIALGPLAGCSQAPPATATAGASTVTSSPTPRQSAASPLAASPTQGQPAPSPPTASVPAGAVATVNGAAITRNDYVKVRKFMLNVQIVQYQFFASQNMQYLALIQKLQEQLATADNDPTDPETIDFMIDDLIAQQRLGQLGLAITDADLAAYIADNFAPGLLSTPTPTRSPNPTAAAWATQTAVAASGGVSPTATPPTATWTPSPTPDVPAARVTATMGYGKYLQDLTASTGMVGDDYVRLVARPALAREKATDKLAGMVAESQPQVRAAHILLPSQAAAAQLRGALAGGQDFAAAARDQSLDTDTAVNGGDLGWFPRGVTVKALEEAAFALAVGALSQPVQSEYGWHLVKVAERDDNRPLTIETLGYLRDVAFTAWLGQQRASSAIGRTVPPPSPSPLPFSPPPGAPPTPTPR